MSVADKLTKLSTDITNAYNSIEDKGGTIPTNKNTENLASAIETITGGGGVTAYTVTFDSNGTESTITIGGTGTFQLDFGDRAITGITITPIPGSQHPIILDYMFD